MTDNSHTLQRSLTARHIMMIAIGGSIGTGLFIASGSAIHIGGPGSAILAYAMMGMIVYFLMMSLGEMSAHMPVTGSFCKYSTDFVSPSFGFAMGYNYWFNWAITIAVELSAASFLMQFWFPHFPFLGWSMIFFVAMIVLNIAAVNIYGETQYWLSLVKVIAIIIFIIIGILLITGVWGHHSPGWSNWTIKNAPFSNGVHGLLLVFLLAGFSFQGTELVGVTAGEADNPEKSMPKAIKLVFWRIMLFYIGTLLIICFMVPYFDKSLINASTTNIGLSPFTLLFKLAGLKYAAGIINFVILIAVLSACNSSMYSATRILWHLGKEKQAPQIFKNLTRKGIPLNALIATCLVGTLVFLSSIYGNGAVFFALVSVSSLCGFVAWVGIAASHYGFRKHYVRNGGKVSDLAFKAKFFPYGTLFSLVFCLIIIAGQGYTLIAAGHFTFTGVLATYSGVLAFLVLWFVHKIITSRQQTAELPNELPNHK